jgi:hypothetical protein
MKILLVPSKQSNPAPDFFPKDWKYKKQAPNFSFRQFRSPDVSVFSWTSAVVVRWIVSSLVASASVATALCQNSITAGVDWPPWGSTGGTVSGGCYGYDPPPSFLYTSTGLPSSLSGSNGCCSASLSASASGQGSAHLTYTAAAAAAISGYARATASQLTIVAFTVAVTSTLRISWRPTNSSNEFGYAQSQLRNNAWYDPSRPLTPGTYILIVDTWAIQDTGPP